MKKIKYLMVSLMSIFALSSSVSAASAGLTVSSNNVYVGDTFTVNVNMGGAAAWNLHTSASGPVSGCIVNVADATADALDTNKTFSATCTATGEGTITISLYGDVTSESDGVAVQVGGTASVNVSKKPAPTPDPTPTPTPPPPPTPTPKPNPNNNNNNNNNTNNNNNNNNTNNNNKDEKKSDNNKLKDISVDGQKLVKVDDNNYTLEVDSDVNSINIKATAEDTKAKVSGDGKHTLKNGVNNLEVIITSESGKENKITIKVTKKGDYYIEDLEKALENSNPTITLKDDTTISTVDLERIKKSGKKVTFNYYKGKELIYSYIIDGNKAKSTSSIPTGIKFNSSNKKDILRLANYVDGLTASLSKTMDLSNGVKIKLYVGNKYKNGNVVNVYSYVNGNEELKLVSSKLKVVDGYITFDGDNASDYFVTTSSIDDNKEVTAEPKKSLLFPIIGAVIGLIAIIVIIILILKKKKNDKDGKGNSKPSNPSKPSSDMNNSNNSSNSNDLDNDFSALINNNSNNINNLNSNIHERYVNNGNGYNNMNSNVNTNTNVNGNNKKKDLNLDDLMKNF